MSVELSIIVPAYNVEKYLPDCLDSILANTYQDFEILLIDDGSADSTSFICDQYKHKNDRIKVFHTKNQGLSLARNLGIENATGSFICFVDADDIVAPEMFHALMSSMSKDIQLCICAFKREFREHLTIIKKTDTKCIEFNQMDIANSILKGSAGPYVWNKLYSRSILNEHNIRFEMNIQCAEDLLFNTKYIQYCEKGVFLEAEMYYYIINSDSIMSRFRSNKVVENNYIGLPKAWRFAAESMDGISEDLAVWSISRATMYYQTVLRKLNTPDTGFVQEAISYVKQHKNTLLRYRWGIKYYLSALVLCACYPLWSKIFRRGID